MWRAGGISPVGSPPPCVSPAGSASRCWPVGASGWGPTSPLSEEFGTGPTIRWPSPGGPAGPRQDAVFRPCPGGGGADAGGHCHGQRPTGTLWAGSLSAAWWVCLPVWGTPCWTEWKTALPGWPSPFPLSRAWNLAPGFGVAALRGSQNNDPFYMDGGQVKTRTNHAGGILGGITNGMPLVFRVAVKPTLPSHSPRTASVCPGEKIPP